MRPRTACTLCRKRQRKCDARELGTACTYCKERRLQCSFATSSPDVSPSKGITWNAKSSGEVANLTTQESVVLPPRDICIEIVSLYFTYIHDTSHSLFHKPTFMNEIISGKAPKLILLCILALGARFSHDGYFEGTDPRTRGDLYAQEAEVLFQLRDISLNTLRAAVLLGAYYGSDGDQLHENLYYTVACRIGGLLHIPNLNELSSFRREMEIRLWWTVVVIDVWTSNGSAMPRLLYHRDDIPLPSSETAFLRMKPDAGIVSYAPMNSDMSTSILAETIKLNSILADIAQLNRTAASQSLSGSDIHSATEALAGRLESWRRGLAPILQDSPLNLAFHASAGTGGPFVALYLGYYHFAQLLYYRYLHLPNLPEDVLSPTITEPQSFAEQCRVNSTLLCETVYKAYAKPGAEVYYSMVGHVLVIASTVQIHILLFSDKVEEVNAARRRLEQNFKILCHLQTLWRALDVSFGRFQAFHAACMKSKDNPTINFRLDKWMVRFLMEFSQPIDERPEEEAMSLDFVNQSTGQIPPDKVIYEAEASSFDLRRWSVANFGIDF